MLQTNKTVSGKFKSMTANSSFHQISSPMIGREQSKLYVKTHQKSEVIAPSNFKRISVKMQKNSNSKGKIKIKFEKRANMSFHKDNATKIHSRRKSEFSIYGDARPNTALAKHKAK